MKKMIRMGMGLWLAAGMALAQQKLTLEDYLQQVQNQGTNYQAAKAQAEGYEKESHQMDLTYSPQLVAGYNHLVDQSQENFSGLLFNNNTQSDAAGVSLVDKFPFGPSLSLGYAFNDTNILGQSLASLEPGYPVEPAFYQLSPVVSLTVPLFKDFGGAQTSAGVKMVQYGLESAQKLSAYQREGVLYNAKVAYWNLALAREEMDIRKDTLDRNQKIWEWTEAEGGA